MFYTYIIMHTSRIENKKNKVIKILTPQVEQTSYVEWLTVQEHVCKLQCGELTYEVRFPEIRDLETGNKKSYMIVPEYLIPGRPYPIYVYIYAITTYCLNPKMGQREAAERTRERFGLKTFSHTTLGRAMKRLECKRSN